MILPASLLRLRHRSRRLLLPLVPLYAAALRLERRLEQRNPARRRSLDGVVLSIGSLSAGGAGKTPLVAHLARLLHDRGYPVQILSRGYGRRSRATERVVLSGDPATSAARFGDEPVLLAHRTGVPVYVGRSRADAGTRATQDHTAQDHGTPTPPVFLLDDGFQHRQLLRDLDIVLLTCADIDDTLLPAGDLREPIEALRRADAIVLREEEAESLTRYVELLTRELDTAPLLWPMRRSLHLPAPPSSRPLAFCGIARPTGFETMLRAAGVEPVHLLPFADHQPYGPRELNRIARAARRSGANGLVTTEKDAVKLSPAARAQLEAAVGPLLIAELRVEFVDERRVLGELIGAVARLDRRRRKR